MAVSKIEKRYSTPLVEHGLYGFTVNNRSDKTTLNTFAKLSPPQDNLLHDYIAPYFDANNFAKMKQANGLYFDRYNSVGFCYILQNYNDTVTCAYVIEGGGRGVYLLSTWSNVL